MDCVASFVAGVVGTVIVFWLWFHFWPDPKVRQARKYARAFHKKMRVS